ncbi:MAG: T9SS type A sorting domain-containing protein [Saprospiraceae bacterium]|nr:T9SS type A sorting domain-containing protein [Saprospiraceae bacterium]
MKSPVLICLGLLCFGMLNSQSISLLKDINDGSNDGFTFVDKAGIAYNDQFVFAAEDADHGSEIWISDGTTDGTQLLADINSGPGGSNCQNFILLGDKVVFTAEHPDYGKELWITDGTEEGTFMVKDIYTGSEGSIESFANGEDYFYVFEGILYFSAENNSAGQELWRSDGTADGTFMVKNISTFTNSFKHSRPSEFEAHQGKLYFSADNTNDGRELYVTDGTAAGTSMVRNLDGSSSSSDPTDLLSLGNHLLFIAEASFFNTELWISDGTFAGTMLLKEINLSGSGLSTNPNSSEKRLHRVGDLAFFSADDGMNGPELWRTDGTEAGTQMVIDFPAGIFGEAPPQNFVVLDSILYYKYDNGSNGNELWRSNGTEAGTYMVKDIRSGFSSSLVLPTSITAHNGLVYFGADNSSEGIELWESDGTEVGTVRISDIYPGGGDARPRHFQSVGERLFFAAFHPDYGFEWWVLGPTQPLVASYATNSPLGCFGDSDGVINLDISGGQTPYTVLLDGVMQPNTDLENLSAGTYEVKVSDATDLIQEFTITIEQPEEIVITSTITPATGGNSDGMIELNVSGGTPPYTFQWDADQQTDTLVSLVGVPAGDYGFTVTDANACTKSENYTVDMTTSLQEVAENQWGQLYPNPVRDKLTIVLSDALALVSNKRLRIFNALGQEVFQRYMPDVILQLEVSIPKGLDSGIYFYRIEGQQTTLASGKVILKR